ncbi:MAG: Arc family DNA-binding protein [Aminipila sp.]
MALSSDKKGIMVRMPIELKKQVEVIAKSENRSVNNYLITLIKREVERG